MTGADWRAVLPAVLVHLPLQQRQPQLGPLASAPVGWKVKGPGKRARVLLSLAETWEALLHGCWLQPHQRRKVHPGGSHYSCPLLLLLQGPCLPVICVPVAVALVAGAGLLVH